LLGPTAAGKSSIALSLAEELGAEVVSVDSMQVYRGMDIGTAKPTVAERARVPHHMIDLVDPEVRFSVAEFQKEGRRVLKDCSDRGVTALIVGGSGLHFRALVDPLDFPPHDPDVRAHIEATGNEAARARLLEVDATAAQVIDLANPRRVQRALEVYELTGLSPSARAARPEARAVADYRAVTPFTAVGVDPGSELAQRVDDRLQEMLSDGFLDELTRLQGLLGPTASGAVGYRQLLPVVKGDTTMQHGVNQALRATMGLAKRQRTYFRRDPRIEWVPWSSDPVERYQRVKECLVEEP
jgi:tRNA dimethylallyltransferase